MAKAQYKKRVRSSGQSNNGLESNAEGDERDLSQPPTKKSKTSQKEREVTIGLLDKIESTTPADRIWSLAAVSNLVLSSISTRQLLLSKQLVNILIRRLKEDEQNEEILIEATSVLRNLVIEGGKDVCGEMVNKGIIPPLTVLISKILDSFLQHRSDVFERKKTNDNYCENGIQTAADGLQAWARLVQMSENLVTIIWSLAEASNKLLELVIKIEVLVPLLLIIIELFDKQISGDSYEESKKKKLLIPSSLALVSSQCLYNLTEDNQKLVNRMISPNEEPIAPLVNISMSVEVEEKGKSLEETENLKLLKALAAGILRNVIVLCKRPKKLSFKLSYDSRLPQILPLEMQTTLDQFAIEAADAYGAVPSIPLSDLNLAKASVQAPSSAEVKLESIERRMTAIQISLELLGEWCACADGFDEQRVELAENDGNHDLEENLRVDKVDGDGSVSDKDEMAMQINLDTQADNSMTGVPLEAIKNAHDSDVLMDEAGSDNHDDGDENDFFCEKFSEIFEKISFFACSTPYFYRSVGSLPHSTNIIPAAASEDSKALLGSLPPLVDELLCNIFTRAIDGINNILITLGRLEGKPSGGFVDHFVYIKNQALSGIWHTCFDVIRKLSHHPNLINAEQKQSKVQYRNSRGQILLSAITCVSSISRLLLPKQESSKFFLETGPDQTSWLIESLRVSQDQETKSRGISALGVLGSRKAITADENKVIGEFIFEVVTKIAVNGDDNEYGLLVMALDTIIDIYSDDERDYDKAVFKKLGFLDHLIESIPKVRSIIKQIDGRKAPIVRQQAKDLLTNLMAFIEYRKTLN
ncbi:hypothetical protein BY996DRAFT_7766323 [Phakopsora pachyrhizi]|nr:hypothetical protein BY996DRAFT_7766323 [Phakopsora pachyrhizi]